MDVGNVDKDNYKTVLLIHKIGSCKILDNCEKIPSDVTACMCVEVDILKEEKK